MSDIKRRPMPKPEVPNDDPIRSDAMRTTIGAQRQLNEKLRQRQLYLADKRTLRILSGWGLDWAGLELELRLGIETGTVAYLFRIDPFGNIHNLSAHESRRYNNNNNNMKEGKNNSNNNFNYDNNVVAAKELHKFSRPTLAELEAEAGRLERL